MIEIAPCGICGAPSEYRICTDIGHPEAAGWLPVPRVYPHRFYCPLHFFLLAEHTQEWTAQQVAREASRATLDDIKRQGLEGEPYQPV